MTYDLLIQNAQILDGTGAPAVAGSVAVQDGNIAAVGNVSGTAHRVIDAKGQTLSPGFIDIHTHMDAQLLWDPLATSTCWHGVTTLILGNCSFAIAPCRPEDHELALKTLVRVEGMSLEALEAGVDWAWETYPQYLDRLDRQLGLNVVAFMGYSSIRQYVMGADAVEREATPDEIEKLQAVVREGLDAGAYGISFNHNPGHVDAFGRPIPCRLANFDELKAMVSMLNGRSAGTIQMSGNPNPAASIPENADVLAQVSGRPVLWSSIIQLFSQPEVWKERLQAAEAQMAAGSLSRGLCTPRTIDVLFTLKNAHIFDGLPAWKAVLTKTPEDVMAALRQPETREALRHDLADTGLRIAFSRRWDMVELVEAKQAKNKPLERRMISDIAAEQGRDPLDVFLDLCLDDKLDTEFLTVLANADEEAAATILKQPYTAIGLSDAGAHAALECGYGFSTHLLGYWVREKQIMPLPEAVRKLTSMLTDLLGLKDRGRIQEGQVADLVLFDPETINCLPGEITYDLPAGARRFIQKSTGISYTIVNGQVLMENNEHAGCYPGQVLRLA
ncbi:N-acyl-D-amino-acid deacylase family protein [Candidatus Entotheonella palauensis]|uniref:N-acyl-D-amino-acid deacylase family protein n=1 Tax=Candidatus Entotheonella palauensis TaxID=93172 RepID=UPI0015C42A12|nr:amidohydrolase family protein [Candidatus Entotheonella palauensis]